MQSESVVFYLNTISQHVVGSDLRTAIQQAAFTNYTLLKTVFEKLQSQKHDNQKYFNFNSYVEHHQTVHITADSYESTLEDVVGKYHSYSKRFPDDEARNLITSIVNSAIFAYETSMPLLLNSLNVVRHSSNQYKVLLGEANLRINEYLRIYPHEKSLPFLTDIQIEKCKHIIDKNYSTRDKHSYEEAYVLPAFFSGALILYYALSGKDLESAKADIDRGIRDINQFSSKLSTMPFGSIIQSMLMMFLGKQTLREFKASFEKHFIKSPLDKKYSFKFTQEDMNMVRVKIFS